MTVGQVAVGRPVFSRIHELNTVHIQLDTAEVTEQRIGDCNVSRSALAVRSMVHHDQVTDGVTNLRYTTRACDLGDLKLWIIYDFCDDCFVVLNWLAIRSIARTRG